jgi:S-adenosylmethionine hydrolase
MEEGERVEIRHIENRRYRLEAEGATFAGRDFFAPAAARLAKGEPPASFGPLIGDPIRFDLQGPVRENQRVIGRIVYVDRFGNLISNITAKEVRECQTAGRSLTIRLGEHVIEGLVGSYSEGSSERPHALINSNGYVEMFLKEGSAAERLGVRPGAAVDCSAA